MKLSPKAAELTRAEWRELGFFYNRDDTARAWVLTGSREGLARFPSLIEEYVTDERSEVVSEHDHIGPHMYLEIATSLGPEIGHHAISGTRTDLVRLASLIRSKLDAAHPGATIEVSSEYSPGCDYRLVLEIRGNDFDPSSLDAQL